TAVREFEIAATRNCIPNQANSSQTTPASTASIVASVSNCRISLQRLAPSAERTPISFWRATDLANCRPAILAQAINSTKATAPITSPTTDISWAVGRNPNGEPGVSVIVTGLLFSEPGG